MSHAFTTRAWRKAFGATAAAVSVLAFLAIFGGRFLPSAEAKGLADPGQHSKAEHVHAGLADEPAPKLIVSPPKPEPLSRGVVLVQFRTENMQIVPVFGSAAAAVTPRIGHLHLTLDDATWHWGHTSNDPVIVAVLPPGLHSILFELADANHQVVAKELLKFEVPQR